jgi:hypothetical protein
LPFALLSIIGLALQLWRRQIAFASPEVQRVVSIPHRYAKSNAPLVRRRLGHVESGISSPISEPRSRPLLPAACSKVLTLSAASMKNFRIFIINENK